MFQSPEIRNSVVCRDKWLILVIPKYKAPFQIASGVSFLFEPQRPHGRLFLNSWSKTEIVFQRIQMIGPCFRSSQETSQRQTSRETVPEAVMGHHDGRHHMMFD